MKQRGKIIFITFMWVLLIFIFLVVAHRINNTNMIKDIVNEYLEISKNGDFIHNNSHRPSFIQLDKLLSNNNIRWATLPKEILNKNFSEYEEHSSFKIWVSPSLFKNKYNLCLKWAYFLKGNWGIQQEYKINFCYAINFEKGNILFTPEEQEKLYLKFLSK